MKILKLIIRNVFRHKLRAMLTMLGIAIAVMSFGLLTTLIGAWTSNSDHAAPDRLVTRHAVSFIFPLPLSYRDQIARVPGVNLVSFQSWFGGIYKDKNQFFPRFCCDPETVFEMYPEFVVPPDQQEAFKKERDACVIGEQLAKDYNLKIGDIMPIDGDIFPGKWQFVVRAIYKGKLKSTENTDMFFHWDYINEQLLKTAPERANKVGWYVERIDNPADAAQVTEKIDALFKNSDAETKTETEKAFAAGFIAMSSAIITGLEIVSYVIIGIIFLVLANTMLMAARERIREYAVLKTLGFTAKHIAGLVFGESIAIGILGGLLGIGLTFPIVGGFAVAMSKYFPTIEVTGTTVLVAGSFALLVGIVAGIIPAVRSAQIKIVDGLRRIG